MGKASKNAGDNILMYPAHQSSAYPHSVKLGETRRRDLTGALSRPTFAEARFLMVEGAEKSSRTLGRLPVSQAPEIDPGIRGTPHSNHITGRNPSMSERIEMWKAWDEIPPFKLPHTNKTLQGYSIAGLRTNFFVQPDLMLDAGLSAPFLPKFILITHGHGDHIANLPFHLIRPDPLSERNIEIYCPKQIVDLIDSFIVSMFRLSDSDSEMVPRGYTIIGVDETTPPAQVLIQNQPHQIEFFRCVHSVPCIGYGVSIIKKKLKAEFAALTSQDIKTLKMTNPTIELSEDRIEPQFFFSGDTTHELFDLNRRILDFPSIIIECTYLDNEETERTRQKKHMAWKNLRPFVVAHPEIQWILSHFSQKYSKAHIEQLFAAEGLANVKLWINVK